MKIGYARVSTGDQNLDLQVDALKKAGCGKIYQEKVSGMKTYRVELAKLLAHLRAGDVLVIWKLDRLGRSLQHLVTLTQELLQKEVGLQSLSDPIDTTTAQGRLVFNIFASLAQFERDLIRERTMAGLASARVRGRLGGRKKGLSAKAQKTALIAEALYKQRQLPVIDLCKQLSISKPTFYRYLRSRGVEIK
ncbi:recombinase family protein [Rhodocytophaga aerolata]|uniref:Recombinase family protein n=1 Tax=Rhodocytophaga aerolata TaxID=455078 RepID=A0ABT8RI87_9BACT|nr:recombinase family protein [Rhodocytophaga aerolata]MDO1451821.1 recombinase family protein [Rhodocytophaga aerolata]